MTPCLWTKQNCNSITNRIEEKNETGQNCNVENFNGLPICFFLLVISTNFWSIPFTPQAATHPCTQHLRILHIPASIRHIWLSHAPHVIGSWFATDNIGLICWYVLTSQDGLGHLQLSSHLFMLAATGVGVVCFCLGGGGCSCHNRSQMPPWQAPYGSFESNGKNRRQQRICCSTAQISWHQDLPLVDLEPLCMPQCPPKDGIPQVACKPWERENIKELHEDIWTNWRCGCGATMTTSGKLQQRSVRRRTRHGESSDGKDLFSARKKFRAACFGSLWRPNRISTPPTLCT